MEAGVFLVSGDNQPEIGEVGPHQTKQRPQEGRPPGYLEEEQLALRKDGGHNGGQASVYQ